jgi:hypothetical protein
MSQPYCGLVDVGVAGGFVVVVAAGVAGLAVGVVEAGRGVVVAPVLAGAGTPDCAL